MTEFRPLTPDLSVAGQITLEDVDQAARDGVRSIINNRPDNEGEDQPSSASLQARAEQLGIVWHHQPVRPGAVEDEDADRFGALLQQLPRPTLAFCRTGTRSTTLWALDATRRMAVGKVLQIAANAGYDLRNLITRLEARRG